MADYIKAAEVRSLGNDDREKRLNDLRRELMHERGVAAMGGSPPSPGKIRQLRRQIARILTIQREDVLVKQGHMRPRAVAGKTASNAPPARKSRVAPKEPREA